MMPELESRQSSADGTALGQREDRGRAVQESKPLIRAWILGPTLKEILAAYSDAEEDEPCGVLLGRIEDDTVRGSLRGLNIVDTRADLLSASRVLDRAALDPYAFVRDAYLQRRESLVHDGNPPVE